MARPRKPRPMKWSVYVGRRSLDVRKFIELQGFRGYDDLVDWCTRIGVIPPAKDELKGMWTRPQKKTAPMPEHTPEPAPKSKKKSTHKKTTKKTSSQSTPTPELTPEPQSVQESSKQDEEKKEEEKATTDV